MSNRAKKRRKAREGDYDRKMVTVKDQKALLVAYHEKFVDPRIQFLEEYVFYKKMKPWEKAWYHWLNLRSWFGARWRAFDKMRYARKCHKKNDEIVEQKT